MLGIGGVVRGRLTRREEQRKHPSRVLGGWRMASVLELIPKSDQSGQLWLLSRARGEPVDGM